MARTNSGGKCSWCGWDWRLSGRQVGKSREVYTIVVLCAVTDWLMAVAYGEQTKFPVVLAAARSTSSNKQKQNRHVCFSEKFIIFGRVECAITVVHLYWYLPRLNANRIWHCTWSSCRFDSCMSKSGELKVKLSFVSKRVSMGINEDFLGHFLASWLEIMLNILAVLLSVEPTVVLNKLFRAAGKRLSNPVEPV